MKNHKLDSNFEPDENSSGTARFDSWGFEGTAMRTLNRHIEPEEIRVVPDLTAGKVYAFCDYLPETEDYVAVAFITDDSGKSHLMNMANFTVITKE